MATVTPAAATHYRRMQRLQVLTIGAAERAWSAVKVTDVRASWAEVEPEFEQVLSSAMSRAAASGAAYGVQDLAQRGTYVKPKAFVNPVAFAKTAPNGALLTQMLTSPTTAVLAALASGSVERVAWAIGLAVLTRMVRTFLADTARQAATVDIVTRPGVGYVRMLNPPSCGDCAVLAGRFYRWNQGFLRHPRCDCIHRPAQSVEAAKAEGLMTDPYAYFDGLSESEQNRLFGRANAEALRDGADIYRVQNARRGRSADRLYTAEGTSKRGFARDLKGQRLTPEGILRTATDRDDAIRLLARHGYLNDGRIPGGSILGSNYEGFGQMGRGGTRKGATAAVLRAQETGIRDGASPYTMTAAERRVFNAEQRYAKTLADPKATAIDKANAEINYRRWLDTRGEVYVRAEDPLASLTSS